MRTFSTLLTTMVVLGAHASDGGYTYYIGAIDQKYAIQMNLTRNAAELVGSYFYASKGEPIDLEGAIGEDGSVFLQETVEEKDTGAFRGAFLDDGRRLEGAWSSADGSKLYPFTVVRFGYQYVEERQFRIKNQPVSISIAHPVFEWGGGAGEQMLNGLITDWVHTREKEFANDATEMIAPDFPAEYSIDIGAEVPYFNRGGFVSVLFFVYTYSGGAHGMSTYGSLNVSLAGDAAKTIALSDLTSDDGIDRLGQKCLENLKKQEASFILSGIVESLGKDELADFTLSSCGITFYFEPYAVGSYAEGPYEVTLPLNELSDIIRAGILESAGLLPNDESNG